MATSTRIQKSTRRGSIFVTVADAGGDGAVMSGAWVSLYATPEGSDSTKYPGAKWRPDASMWLASERTDREGRATFTELDPACYVVRYEHHPKTDAQCVDVEPGCSESVCFQLPFHARLEVTLMNAECQELACPHLRVGDHAHVAMVLNQSDVMARYITVQWAPGMRPVRNEKMAAIMPIKRAGAHQVGATMAVALVDALPNGQAGGPGELVFQQALDDADEREAAPISGSLNVALARSETAPTADLKLWGAIRASTEALSFEKYQRFMNQLFCPDGQTSPPSAEKAAYSQLLKKRFLPFTDTDSYRVLKAATEAFVMVNCGVFTGEAGLSGGKGVLADLDDYLQRRDLPRPGRERYLESVNGVDMLPYMAIIRRKLPDVPLNRSTLDSETDADLCDGFVQEKLSNPCMLELIWSYWEEECTLVQTMNAITRRFQNVRGARQPDPLVNIEVNPLRPLNNLLWGYIQDEQHRLTVARRNAEYDHHYGLRLEGRAVQGFRPADSRSKFLEAFHHLLRLCTVFYKQDDNTTVKADAFGVLNALKEVHLILSQGAHSQFGDLPPTARIEMLVQQWLLSRPEFREFLPTRVMVAYPEPWMDRVDAMKKLQGWSDTSALHFHNLAVFGEQLLLSIRYGAWSTVYEPTQAFNFARFWRPQVLGYIHAYRAATGAELGAETVETRVDATQPSALLKRRLAAQQRRA
jgi:hypothetical protein